jgi:hypothetical protein
MKITAVMVTCPERSAIRQQTLANLEATDWGEDVTVVVDQGSGPDRIARIDATWQRALAVAAESEADLILTMEDDLRTPPSVWLPSGSGRAGCGRARRLPLRPAC